MINLRHQSTRDVVLLPFNKISQKTKEFIGKRIDQKVNHKNNDPNQLNTNRVKNNYARNNSSPENKFCQSNKSEFRNRKTRTGIK